jgi:hypothetical protein
LISEATCAQKKDITIRRRNILLANCMLIIVSNIAMKVYLKFQAGIAVELIVSIFILPLNLFFEINMP